jgi:periplasmic divalent cation tolerance protein
MPGIARPFKYFQPQNMPPHQIAGFVVIFVTCPSRKEAKAIAGSLIRKRLVACANFAGGIESLFWWKGKIDKAKEVLVMMKARRKDFKAVEREVKRLHSYDVPEIIALPIACGSMEYLGWIEENVR